jgi:hypothetical protein
MAAKKAAEVVNARRAGARTMAAVIAAREAKAPGFWRDVQSWVTKHMAESTATHGRQKRTARKVLRGRGMAPAESTAATH